MQSQMSAELALDLLDWNRRHLTYSSGLTESLLAEKFAAEFEVRANGRIYRANHSNYKEFLDGFRQSIECIEYEVGKIVAQSDEACLSMSAKITRKDRSVDKFEAMLLLGFDEHGLVKLWQEVYVKVA